MAPQGRLCLNHVKKKVKATSVRVSCWDPQKVVSKSSIEPWMRGEGGNEGSRSPVGFVGCLFVLVLGLVGGLGGGCLVLQRKSQIGNERSPEGEQGSCKGDQREGK